MDCDTFVLITPITYIALIVMGYYFGNIKKEKEVETLEEEVSDLLEVINEMQEKADKTAKTLKTLFESNQTDDELNSDTNTKIGEVEEY